MEDFENKSKLQEKIWFKIILSILFWPAKIVMKIFNKSNKSKELIKSNNIPKNARRVCLYNNINFKVLDYKAYFWNDDSNLYYFNNKDEIKIKINKNDIVSFTILGEYHETTNTSGGGASIGGAIVGGTIAGPVGAIIGGRKKIKTDTSIEDTRKVAIKYIENEIKKSVILGYAVYDSLCYICPEKKIS